MVIVTIFIPMINPPAGYYVLKVPNTNDDHTDQMAYFGKSFLTTMFMMIKLTITIQTKVATVVPFLG